MKSEDLAKLRQAPIVWPASLWCSACGGAPTCPMLHDHVWAVAWENSRAVAVHQLECTCPRDALVRARPDDWSHARDCDLRKGSRQLLCFECAEQFLGRCIELDDLAPCVGNYALFVMTERR